VPSLTLKGIPDSLLERLRRSAALHRRSLNSEVLYRLESTVAATRVDPEEFISRVESLQSRTSLPLLTDELLNEAKDEGRP
jgi:antitoxin FitA